jgi:lysophospholipase L1-like esterase
MLSLGDSAIWGNGLNDENKYSQKVAKYLADQTGRPVHLVSYAHSGASLANETEGNWLPLIPDDKGTPPGDLSSRLPATSQQGECASEKYSSAELILLNGCINDVGATNIALPFPFSFSSPKKIRKLARQFCSDHVLSLLKTTKEQFPQATAIVSNYWLIVSDKSNPLGTALQKSADQRSESEQALVQNAKNYADAEIQAERLLEPNAQAPSANQDLSTLFLKWSDRSRAFLDVSTHCFEWAIAAANGEPVSPLPKDPTDCVSPKSHPTVPASRAYRVYLARVSDDPNYSYGTGPASRLWSVPLTPDRYDDLFDVRSNKCQTHYKSGDLANLFICPINPTAHPNHAGADAFRDSIKVILDVAWRKQ